jgi:hypothetical protein
MKRFALLVALLLSGGALAQNEIGPERVISLAKGQVKVLQFDEPIQRVNVILKGVVDVEPVTDKQLSLAGTSAGETRIIVFSDKGQMIYNAAVTVTPEPGRVVKIYGHDKNDDLNAGYSSVWCNDLGCGRPDIDIPKPTAVTVERIRTDRAPRR